MTEGEIRLSVSRQAAKSAMGVGSASSASGIAPVVAAEHGAPEADAPDADVALEVAAPDAVGAPDTAEILAIEDVRAPKRLRTKTPLALTNYLG